MNFVKSQIYKQKITKDGITETLKELRSKEELEQIERLKKLPEFQNKERFLSLSVQLERNRKDKYREKGVYDDDDLYFDDELLLMKNTDQPYLNVESGLYSNTQSLDGPNDQTQQLTEMEIMKKEYEETKNSILRKKKIEREKEMIKQKEKEESFLSKELKILKETKKNLSKGKKGVKYPHRLFTVKSFIKVKPNQKEENNNTNKEEESIQLKKKNKDINDDSSDRPQKKIISLVSGYSDESESD